MRVILLFFIILSGCTKVDNKYIDPGLYCNTNTGSGFIVPQNAYDLKGSVYIEQGACSMGSSS